MLFKKMFVLLPLCARWCFKLYVYAKILKACWREVHEYLYLYCCYLEEVYEFNPSMTSPTKALGFELIADNHFRPIFNR